jgi:surface antigen
MAASGAGSMREALSVGHVFLASPAATRVAAGRSTQNTVVVKEVYKDKAGRACRVVEQTVMIDGQNVRANGKVCRTGGRWALAP